MSAKQIHIAYRIPSRSWCYNACMGGIISRITLANFWTGIVSSVIGLAMLILPFSAYAEPFGGQASFVWPCFNATIYALLGPPRGGAYIWTPSTRTYQNGPPTHAGQWLLGLKTIPFLCLYSNPPLVTIPGIGILMMGSSR